MVSSGKAGRVLWLKEQVDSYLLFQKWKSLWREKSKNQRKIIRNYQGGAAGTCHANRLSVLVQPPQNENDTNNEQGKAKITKISPEFC
jgi:hypothetical protein